jgi:hypothetical protein
MHSTIPSAEEVCAALAPMTTAQLTALAKLSGVAITTLINIRAGHAGDPDVGTKDPRIGTVHKFWPHVRAVADADA